MKLLKKLKFGEKNIRYILLPCILLLILNGFFLILLLKNDSEISTPAVKVRPKVTMNSPEVTNLIKKNNMSFKELSQYFTQVSNKKGADYAFEVLKISPIPKNIDIHLLAHVVGDELYKQQGAYGMRICTQDFRNACSHSIVVALFIEKGPQAIKEITKICNEAPGGKGAYPMCFHGLGHGVLAYNNYNMEKAITMCKTTESRDNTKREFVECVGGTTMESISGVHDPKLRIEKSKNYFSASDPLSPCNKGFIPKDAKPICYTYLTPYLFEAAGADINRLTDKDFEIAFKFCDKIPLKEVENRESCYGGFGKEFVVLINNRDVRNVPAMSSSRLTKVSELCMLANTSTGKSSCITQSVKSLYWAGENEPTGVLNFCKVIKDSRLMNTCYKNLLQEITYYQPGIFDTVCSMIPPSQQALCKKAT